MSLYEKNLTLIKKTVPELYNIINSTPINMVKIEKLEDQLNYVVENESARCFLHSIYSIDEEMKMTFEDVNLDSEFIVLFGCGCGYEINYIINNFKNLDRLIIVEPSLEIFLEYLKNNMIDELLKIQSKITLIVNQQAYLAVDMITKHITNYSNVEFVANISYRTLFSKYYEITVSKTIENIQIKKSNMSVSNYSWMIWLLNSIKNLKQNNLRIEDLEDVMNNKPIIIVSAGPSLNKNIHLLQKVYNKAIIVAVGTAIKILDNHGIKPHFRAAYDGTPEEEKIFGNLKDDSIPLIYGSRIFHEIPPKYSGTKFLITVNEEYFRKYINREIEFKDFTIASGGSIANIAVNLACSAKCSKIILLGQDLCYYNADEIYAKGSHKDNIINKFEDDIYIPENDIYGNNVYTNFVFLNMRYSMIQSTKNYTNVKFINCTEGGLNIEGFENGRFVDVIEKELNIDVDFNLENSLSKIDVNKILLEQKLKINEIVEVIKKQNKELMLSNKERLDLLIKLKENISKNANINKLTYDISKIEKYEDKLCKIPFYKEVVSKDLKENLDAIILAFKQTEDDTFNKIISFEKILTAICSEIQIYLLMTEELIEEYINEVGVLV